MADVPALILEMQGVAERCERARTDFWSHERLDTLIDAEKVIKSAIAYLDAAERSLYPVQEWPEDAKFAFGQRVTKIKGSSWTGPIVGWYRSSLTPLGYNVESENEPGSVQLYPESALAARPHTGGGSGL